MKRLLTIFLALAMLFSLSISAFASDSAAQNTQGTYTVVVDGKTLELNDLPVPPYSAETTIMVPLRIIGEALGYTVGWDAESGAITLDDNCIQKAILYDGTAKVVFEGKLKVIDLSREIENAVQTVIHNGYTYVPLEFFQEFFNDTAVDGNTITIAPSKSELHNESK